MPAILNKIASRLDNLGVSYTRDSSSITVDTAVISYSDAVISSPMGGVSDASAPFLGIGIAAPGKLVFKGAAGQNTIAAIFTSAARVNAFAVLCGFSNNVIVQKGDDTSTLVEVAGCADVIGVGQ